MDKQKLLKLLLVCLICVGSIYGMVVIIQQFIHFKNI